MINRKVLLYISISLDGYIAAKNDDLSWLSLVEKEGLDYGYSDMLERSDTYIVGRKTYDVVKSLTDGKFPQSSMFDCYIITRKEQSPVKGVTFYTGELKDLINRLKSEKGKDIYCDGGSQVVKLLMKDNLIDEYIISIIPTILGDGIQLFKGGISPIDLEFVGSQNFETGLVQVHYRKKMG
jgi:dihydrofolate reductase